MFELALIGAFGLLAFFGAHPRDDELPDVPRAVGTRLGKLWDIAHQGMRENRFLRAEKALLTILKIDERNAAAYNRLGILYAKQKEYKDAIDCFEIASSIEVTPSALHNLGLIYYETENYEKAAIAFEHALKLEDGLAARHVAYAKVQEKLGHDRLMLHELERALELEPARETYTLLIKAYRSHGREDDATALEATLQTTKQKKKPGAPIRMVRPRRVVI